MRMNQFEEHHQTGGPSQCQYEGQHYQHAKNNPKRMKNKFNKGVKCDLNRPNYTPQKLSNLTGSSSDSDYSEYDESDEDDVDLSLPRTFHRHKRTKFQAYNSRPNNYEHNEAKHTDNNSRKNNNEKESSTSGNFLDLSVPINYEELNNKNMKSAYLDCGTIYNNNDNHNISIYGASTLSWYTQEQSVSSSNSYDASERLLTMYENPSLNSVQSIIEIENPSPSDAITSPGLPTLLDRNLTLNSIQNHEQLNNSERMAIDIIFSPIHDNDIDTSHLPLPSVQCELISPPRPKKKDPILLEEKKKAQSLLKSVVDEDCNTLLHIKIKSKQHKEAIEIINHVTEFGDLDTVNRLWQTPLHLAVISNDAILVRRLMVAGCLNDIQDYQGNTPLHIACKEGYTQIVNLLIKPVSYSEVKVNKFEHMVPFIPIPQDVQVKNNDNKDCLDLSKGKEFVNIIEELHDFDTFWEKKKRKNACGKCMQCKVDG